MGCGSCSCSTLPPPNPFPVLVPAQGYRARSAFKLIQLNKKYDFLSSAQCVIDLCAAPGGWLQVAQKFCPMSARIIGVDLNPIRPIHNVLTHQADITTVQCRQLLRRDMGSAKADVVLHDGAPNVGADWRSDAYQQSILTLHSVKLATEFLRPGGLFITKVFRSADYTSLLWVFNQLFSKVEATKPHSSRNASAEIFVVCQGYYAPSKIDARMLDPNHVFKDDVDVHAAAAGSSGGDKPLSVMHPKGLMQRRSRNGYKPERGLLQLNEVPVRDFFLATDPVEVISDATALVFTGESEQYLSHPSTTSEIKALCEDLKVIGRADFKLLLKWRMRINKEEVAAKRAAAAAAGGADQAGHGKDSATGGGSESDSDEDEELAQALTSEAKRKRAERKREAKRRQRAIKKHMYGMTGQSVDIDAMNAEVPRFSLAAITGKLSNPAVLDEIADVDLDTMDATDQAGIDAIYEGEAPLNPLAEKPAGDASDASEEVGEEEYLAALEGALDRHYEEFKEKRRSRDAAAAKAAIEGRVSKGVKLTRRGRMEAEAAAKVAQAEAKLDYKHQEYLKLLAGMRAKDSRPVGGSDDESSGDEGGDSDNSDGFWDAHKQDRTVDSDEEGDAAIPSGSSASAAAARWFSNPAVSGVLPVGTVEFNTESRGTKRARGGDSDDDGFEDGSDDDGLPDFMRDLPKSERELRKERLKRAREKEEYLAKKRTAHDDSKLQIVKGPAASYESEGDESADDEGKVSQATKDLIKAGMGAALAGKSVSSTTGKAVGPSEGGFETVPRLGDAADDDDPRDQEYDSDTHAEILALGKLMRQHTTAKALVDASYNRYSFDDGALPSWFAADEAKHFRPQLPVSKADVEQIKARFRDIAARPIHKVMEARARKKHRSTAKLAKARRAAEAIAADETMGHTEKMKAMARTYRGTQKEKREKVYVVASKGGNSSLAVRGARKRGAAVKQVDSRLRADTRGEKNARFRSKKRAAKRRRK